MKKTVKILSIVAGSLLIGNFILLILISNLNIGMIPVGGLGAVLLGYGILYDRLPFKKIIGSLLAFGIAVITICARSLASIGSISSSSHKK